MRGRSTSLFLLLCLVAAGCGSVHPADDTIEIDGGAGEIDGGDPLVFPLEVVGGPLDFAGVAVGQRSVAISLTVHNRSAVDAGPLTSEKTGAVDEFELVDGCAGMVLAPGATCRIVVTFRPLAAGARSAMLAVGAVGHGGATTTSLAGRGLTGALTITPPLHDFGAIDCGTQSVPVSFDVDNTGQVISGSLSVSVSDATLFRIVDDTCTGTTVAVGGRCTFRIAFAPSALGASVGSVEIDGGVAGASAASLGGRGQATVTVSRAGMGTGTITSTPAGIDCGTTCAARFETAPVTLAVQPAAGNAFMGWSGECAGATCVLPLSSPNASVTATFEPLRTVTVNPTSGTVRIDPPGADCAGMSCDYTLPRTTQVQLHAMAPEGYVFRRWYGVACSGQSSICTMTVGASTTTTASFCVEDDVCCFSPGLPGCN